MNIGIALVAQETNTFSVRPTAYSDFEANGIFVGAAALECCRGTNTELAGAADAIAVRGSTPVPLVRAWTMPAGRIEREAFLRLRALLVEQLTLALPLDGLVLSLHGAMASQDDDDADAALLAAAREVLGTEVPIVVSLDLHANVTTRLVAAADAVIGYHTNPHVDMADTGRRAAGLVLDLLEARIRPVTSLAKRPMIVPAESMLLDRHPMKTILAAGAALTSERVIDISIFPPQPWLDIEEMGFGVLVTTDGDSGLSDKIAEELASLAWALRHDFMVETVAPREAIERARRSSVRPFLLSESADAPTAGAGGDSPAMIHALLQYGRDLRALVTLVDGPAVAQCHVLGEGAYFAGVVGATVDRRFHEPVQLEGDVTRIGAGDVALTGPVATGLTFNLGRWAAVRSAGLDVLITERAAPTIDPVIWRHAGLDPEGADVIVVRSPTLFRAGYPASAEAALTLDLPGASTPQLGHLSWSRVPRPMFPLDA